MTETNEVSKKPSFVHSGLKQPINRFVSPIISTKGSKWVVYGTCVIIVPGLAVTAKHVIEDLIKDFEDIYIKPTENENKNYHGSHNSFIFQIVDGDKVYKWDVRKYFLSPNTDICYLLINPMFSYAKLPVTQKIIMTLHAPQVGDRISGYGFPKCEISLKENIVTTKIKPMSTIGEVIEVHQMGRDQRLPFPVFRTNARFDAGMSGGPVFNDSGKLCGIICSNLPPFESNEDHVSYVTLIWPSMDTKIWMKLANHDLEELFPILFLAENNYIAAEGWEKIDTSIKGKIIWRK